VTEVYSAGILGLDPNPEVALTRINSVCFISPFDKLYNPKDLDEKAFKKAVYNACWHKSTCEADVSLREISKNGEAFPAETGMVFFAQVACTVADATTLEHINMWGLFVATIGLLICIIYRLTMTQIKYNLKIEDKFMDYTLISIDDYSV